MNGFIRSMGDLDKRIGVRVNGVAPGIIKTPLWTEHPEKMGFLDEGRDRWVEPEEVAEAMVRVSESLYMCGTYADCLDSALRNLSWEEELSWRLERNRRGRLHS